MARAVTNWSASVVDLLAVIARFESIYHMPPTTREIAESINPYARRPNMHYWRHKLDALEAAGRLVRSRAQVEFGWAATWSVADTKQK